MNNWARKYFPGEDAIGRQIKINELDNLPETPHDAYFEIVGVVSNARNFDFEGFTAVLKKPEKTNPKAFLPYSISGLAGRRLCDADPRPPRRLSTTYGQSVASMDHDVVLVAPNVAGATGYSLDEVMQTLVLWQAEVRRHCVRWVRFAGIRAGHRRPVSA